MKYIKALIIAGLSLPLTWAVASILQQWSMGQCAMKGGCVGNVIISSLVGLYISPLFIVPFLLAIRIFITNRAQRYRHSFFYMCCASGVASGGLTLISMTIIGIPYDLIIWPLVFFLVSTIMIFIFYREHAQ